MSAPIMDEVSALLEMEASARNLVYAIKVYPQDLQLHCRCYKRLTHLLGKLDQLRGTEFDSEASLLLVEHRQVR